jgi:hypothetical protein
VSSNGFPLSEFWILERNQPSLPAIGDIAGEVGRSLSALQFPAERLRGRRIAITVGSRGIASLREVVRAVCAWLKAQGATPFAFPAMGSHAGATGSGQLEFLAGYGVTPEFIGAEILSSMETVSLGRTAEGIEVSTDRNAWEADGVVVLNRIKPHTAFSGKIESGLMKMMAVGMGKIRGAQEIHRASRRLGFEAAIRAVAGQVLASGKILCGLGLVENELHQLAAIRAARPEEIAGVEEQTLEMARRLVARLPFSELDLLVVDEMGKNISGSGMDTKVIGRGAETRPGEAPAIRLIYVRDLTEESGGNALGVGMADLIHERLYRKVNLEKTYVNVRTSLNAPMARLPMFFPADRAALDFALAALGSPDAGRQRIAWIRSTLAVNRFAISAGLSDEASRLDGWHVSRDPFRAEFDAAGNLAPLASKC